MITTIRSTASYYGDSWFLSHFRSTVHQPIIMQPPKLRYLPASSRCILQLTPGYRTPHGYGVSGVCFSEAGRKIRLFRMLITHITVHVGLLDCVVARETTCRYPGLASPNSAQEVVRLFLDAAVVAVEYASNSWFNDVQVSKVRVCLAPLRDGRTQGLDCFPGYLSRWREQFRTKISVSVFLENMHNEMVTSAGRRAPRQQPEIPQPPHQARNVHCSLENRHTRPCGCSKSL